MTALWFLVGFFGNTHARPPALGYPGLVACRCCGAWAVAAPLHPHHHLPLARPAAAAWLGSGLGLLQLRIGKSRGGVLSIVKPPTDRDSSGTVPVPPPAAHRCDRDP